MKRLTLAVPLALLLCTARARAADCTPASRQSPCVPASALWVRPGASPFLLLPDPEPEAAGRVSVSLTGEYSLSPLTLEAASPDPAGREIPVVKHRVGLTAGARLGLGQGLDLGLSLPLVLFQEGTGARAVTSRSASPLPQQALGDPRLEARFQLLHVDDFRAAISNTLLLPLGDESAHAGERGFVMAPELLGSYQRGRLQLSAALGARLRQPVELGGAEHGTELGALFGARLTALPRWLTLSAELSVSSGLSWVTTESAGGATSERLERPAAWLLGIATTPTPELRVLLAGGGALPLSVTERTSPPQGALPGSGAEPVSDTHLSAALGVPAFHGLLSLQYQFGAL
ncbi:MAG: hypothetical protein KIT72_10385 [Polyangiaceae bacterium]|nr:hypothetical protein [Polyangiaceae bacterium]MCW5790819.1 hypothetical protein [Polyangiaceae bacterium]